MSNLESLFSSWKNPPSDSEELKCENARRMIFDAIRKSSSLQAHDVEVCGQGSYRSNTNVRLDSDIDICVRCKRTVYPDYSLVPGYQDPNLHPTAYHVTQFKQDVFAALKQHFSAQNVEWRNKSLHLRDNSYRVRADVVAAGEHRLYYQAKDGCIYYITPPGTQIVPDSGIPIVNWPEQHYTNGVNKNKATQRRFKHLVRIFKRVRNKMADDNHSTAPPMASFLLESLVWNVPDDFFVPESYVSTLRGILGFLYSATFDLPKCQNWKEINGIKLLFSNEQPWICAQVSAFVRDASNYLGFS